MILTPTDLPQNVSNHTESRPVFASKHRDIASIIPFSVLVTLMKSATPDRETVNWYRFTII